MPNADPWGEFVEILEAIDRIESYVAGLDAEGFRNSRKDIDAAAMNLIVIGEAVRRLDAAILADEPEIPWPAVVSMRNRIAHGYSGVQWDIVWFVICDELPRLRLAVERMKQRRPPAS